jgi:hypothetical protein
VSEAVRVESWQAGALERLLKDGADRASVAPVLAGEAGDLELTVETLLDQGGWEERIVSSPEALRS